MSAKESSETTQLRQRVAALKREAASLGLLGPSSSRPSVVVTPKAGDDTRPSGFAPRGRVTGPLSRGVLANRAVDRRPRQLLVTGFKAEEKEDVLTELLVIICLLLVVLHCNLVITLVIRTLIWL